MAHQPPGGFLQRKLARAAACQECNAAASSTSSSSSSCVSASVGGGSANVPFSSASDGLQLQPAGCTRSRRAARQRQTKETSNQQVHARSAQGKSPRFLYLFFFLLFLFLGRSGAQAGAVRSGAQVGNGFLLFLRGTNGRGGPQRVSMSFSGLLRTFLSSSRLAPATSTCRAHKYCSSFFARGLPAVRV